MRLSFQLFLPSINRFLLRLLEIFVLRAHVNLYVTRNEALNAHLPRYKHVMHCEAALRLTLGPTRKPYALRGSVLLRFGESAVAVVTLPLPTNARLRKPSQAVEWRWRWMLTTTSKMQSSFSSRAKSGNAVCA